MHPLQPKKGKVLEWLKRHAWKACIPLKGIESSNLFLSAITISYSKSDSIQYVLSRFYCLKKCLFITVIKTNEIFIFYKYFISDFMQCVMFTNPEKTIMATFKTVILVGNIHKRLDSTKNIRIRTYLCFKTFS